MIIVETDADPEWDSSTDWSALAARAVGAAVAASRESAVIDSRLLAEVSVKFTSDAAVRALNASYRRKDSPTNVLSFPMLDEQSVLELSRMVEGEILLGDVVLAHGVCLSEAAGKGIPIDAHAAHLVVHGVLHLLGYDHETGDSDADAMETVERAALAAIGIDDPYVVTEVQN